MALSILDSVFAGENGLAKTLVNLLGSDASIQLPDGLGSYAPTTGIDTEGNLSAAIAIEIAALEEVSEKSIPNSNVIVGDFQCIIPEFDVALERKHINHAVIEFNGIRYKLVWFKPVYSGQEIAMYTAYLRNL